MLFRPTNISRTFPASRFCSLCASLMIAVGASSFGQQPEPNGANGAAEAQAPKKVEITNSSFQAGLKSLKDNLPDIAATHFKKALESGPKKGVAWNEEERALIEGFLAESLVRANKAADALPLYDKLPETPANDYWRAIAFVQKGSIVQAMHWLNQIDGESEWSTPKAEAMAYLADRLNDQAVLEASLRKLVASTDPVTAKRSSIWLANCLLKQKKTGEARQIITPFLKKQADAPTPNGAQYSKAVLATLDTLQPFADLTYARVLAAMQNINEARSVIAALSATPNTPSKIQDLAKVELAANEIAYEKRNIKQTPSVKEQPAETNTPGEDQLLAFIAGRIDSTLLPQAFDLLLKENTFLSNPQAYEQLVSWANQADSTRQPVAAYALANTLFEKKEVTESLDVAEKSLKKTPSHPVTQKLALQMIERLIKLEQYDSATKLISMFPVKSGEIYFNEGVISFEKKDYKQAADEFNRALQLADDSLIQQAYFNANLNAAAMGDKSLMEKLVRDTASNPGLQEQLAYEQVHYAAQNFEPNAVGLLEGFILKYPASAYKPDAMLDLAEVALGLNPPELDIARKQLALLEENPSPDKRVEVRMDYLRILIPETQEIWPDAIEACRQALKKHSDSDIAPILQLKLGELLFKNENFNEALLVLQKFPEQNPDSKLKEDALFLAGKSAQLCNSEASLQKALEIFRSIEKANGKLTQSAVIEIASILQQRMGQSKEAIEVLQPLLKQKLTKQTKLMALSIQASAWASLTDDEEGTALKKACDLCTQILDTPNIMPSWRFKALTQRAEYQIKAGNTQSALDDYYSILSYFVNKSNFTKKEWFWYYNTGFSALNLLEKQQDWDKALALAKKLADSKGPKALEASNKARKIQMEHFIWNSDDSVMTTLEKHFFDEKTGEAPTDKTDKADNETPQAQ